MKKLFAIILAIALAFSLCACAELDRLRTVELPPLPEVTAQPEAPATAAEEPAPESSAEPAEPVEPEAAESAVPETPAHDADAAEAMKRRVTVNYHTTELLNYDPAEGEQLILSFSYTTPFISIDGREEAAAAINEYIAMLDETFYTGNDYGDGPSYGYYGMLEQAEDNFAYVHDSGSTMPVEFACSRGANITRADGRILSLQFGEYFYTGGAHGIYDVTAYVFDTESGQLLTMADLGPDPEALSDRLVQSMLEQAEQEESLNEAIAPYLNREDWKDAFSALLREGSWYLDGQGLVIFSSLYEIAPYAAGIQSFHFSYEALGDLIDARWLPGEKHGEGGFDFLQMEEIEEGSFPILDKITLAEGFQELCLKSGACVYDVSLCRTSYSEWSESFILGDELWHCSCMQDCGLQLAVDLPDGAPNLALSYRTGDNELHRCLLSFSGEDGHLILMEDGVSFIE